jgi:DNA-binding GntR family transcriptional regulator
LLPAESGWIVQRPAPEEIRHIVRRRRWHERPVIRAVWLLA